MNIIKDLKHIHFTGIKGVGMTSLALCLQDLGIQISGSDIPEVFVTDEILAKRKINWKAGFGKQNLKPRPDLVITTGAHGGLNNPEVIAAKKMGIPVLTHAEALGRITKGKDTIAVCGVGGKTTTSSMIATLLDYGGLNPSFAIGVGNIFPLGVPARFDKMGNNFICEADEYANSFGVDNRPRFSYLTPKILIVTNIEHDHPDLYPSLEETKKTFHEFFLKVGKDGLLIACLDNLNVSQTIRGLGVPVATYGFNEKADWQIKDVYFKEAKTHFSLIARQENKRYEDLVLNIPGRFNTQNATAAFIAGRFLGLQEDPLRKGLEKYLGCRRRFEKIGEIDGVSIYDDYAHHPKELKALLLAAKEWFGDRRVVALFQPHTYSRTKALFNDFSRSFGDADVIAFMDIYASAREKPDLGVNSKKLAQEVKKYQRHVYYTAGQKETVSWIKREVRVGDVLITLGAGDIFHLHKNLLKTLHE